MQTTDFWKLIEASNVESYGVCMAQADALQARLSVLTTEEIADFDRLFRNFRARAYRWNLWGAAYIINGGCSDDGFLYFRAWLIGRGEAIYTSALTDPESLADMDVEFCDAECEDLLYAAARAYEGNTGVVMPSAEESTQPAEPAGEPWVEDDLASYFPQLSAKYRY